MHHFHHAGLPWTTISSVPSARNDSVAVTRLRNVKPSQVVACDNPYHSARVTLMSSIEQQQQQLSSQIARSVYVVNNNNNNNNSHCRRRPRRTAVSSLVPDEKVPHESRIVHTTPEKTKYQEAATKQASARTKQNETKPSTRWTTKPTSPRDHRRRSIGSIVNKMITEKKKRKDEFGGNTSPREEHNTKHQKRMFLQVDGGASGVNTYLSVNKHTQLRVWTP